VPIREVPLAEAATLLGLTPEAVRLRLRRGKTLRGTKRPEGWYVALPADLDVTDRDLDANGSRSVTNNHATADDGSRPNAATDRDHSRPAPPTAQDAEVAWLRAEVERLHERLRETHVLLGQRTLLAPMVQTLHPDPPRPWWSWRRWLLWP
jgi:hypothetical protein